MNKSKKDKKRINKKEEELRIKLSKSVEHEFYDDLLGKFYDDGCLTRYYGRYDFMLTVLATCIVGLILVIIAFRQEIFASFPVFFQICFVLAGFVLTMLYLMCNKIPKEKDKIDKYFECIYGKEHVDIKVYLVGFSYYIVCSNWRVETIGNLILKDNKCKKNLEYMIELVEDDDLTFMISKEQYQELQNCGHSIPVIFKVDELEYFEPDVDAMKIISDKLS